MCLLQYVATLLYGGNMNVAMMTAGCALWNDEVVLGSQVVGGWDNTECEAARSEAYIEDVILGEHAPEGRLAVSEADGWVLANIGELPSVRLASSGGLTAEAVRDILVGRLARLRRWLYDLHRGVRTGRAAAIMDAGAALMGRSLVLFDGAFNLVAASLVEDEVTQAMRETERRGYASEVSADHQALYRELSLSRPDGFGIMYPEADRLTPVWSQPVAAGSETFRMHVMELMEDDLGEIALAHCVAGELASLLDRSRANDTVNAGMDIVSELLHRQHEEGEARIRARFFGWSIENAWVAARVEAVDQSYPPARWNQIAGMGRSRLEGSHASAPDVDGFALVVPAHVLEETDCKQLCNFCAAEGIVIGWGDPVDGLSGLPASYEQARHACTAAKRDGKPTALAYDYCKLNIAKTLLAKEFATQHLEPLALLQVRAHDAQYGTGYETTLRALFENNLVKLHACEQLHIHRTTLDYRLGRLRDEFAINLDDPDTRDLLRLAFLAVE